MMDFLVMTQRADGTTVIWSVTQIANPDGRCLMIWRRYRCKATVQSDAVQLLAGVGAGGGGWRRGRVFWCAAVVRNLGRTHLLGVRGVPNVS